MLSLYNSLTRTIDPFEAKNDQKVTLYVCGITPYDTTHLGHAFTYLSFDVLVRYLTYLGKTVEYTQNVTDINDRDNDILKKAKEQNTTWEQLAEYWTQRFLDDMKALNWVFPAHYLKASEQIPAMIETIDKVIKSDLGYIKDGNIFLDIEKDTDFGKLSRLSKEEMLVKAKDFEEDLDNPLKRHPLDITLWRATTATQAAHIPSFDSPWGKGRPGWHIECSAMALHSLSDQIDIHGGGIDLIYPHHESEVAQSEAATGKKPFASHWMHTGTVGINGQKMSKSLGNLILISDLLKTYSPNAIRWVLLSHHYREAWEYNEEELKQANETINVILNEVKNIKLYSSAKPQNDMFKRQGLQLLDNDLDTPGVLKLIENSIQTAGSVTKQEMKELLTMLGFIF